MAVLVGPEDDDLSGGGAQAFVHYKLLGVIGSQRAL